MTNIKLFSKKLRNSKIYREAQEIGFEYILNPMTGELHRVGLDDFLGSHNLEYADLEKFLGLTNLGSIPIHTFRGGIGIPVYDLDTGEFIGNYTLNKCGYCFPK